MNQYGAMARSHWARWLPQRYATITDPDSFFLALGLETARQIDELTPELAGDDQPGEGYLAKAGRLAAARSQAEEIIFPQQILLPPEPGTSEDPEETGLPPASAGTAAGRGPQPPAVGGSERRAAGTGSGQLTSARFRPCGQDDLAPSGTVARIRANLAALTTLRAIHHEHRPATPGEQVILARWSGWGAAPEVFDPDRRAHTWAREELSRLLTPAELAAAARNTLNAHYTDAALVQAIWTGIQQLRFTGGRVLEPGCGSGNFIGFAPVGARFTGVELEPVTAQIAAALYPDADIVNESFADTRAREGSFDLAIGNVPFGSFALTDRLHNPGGHSIHNHFIIKALHLVRPGGLVAVVTSRYTMDARNPAARREIAALADLAGAVRLPSGAHQRAAGTGVVTDLLIFRRREPGRQPDATGWEQTRMAELDGVQVPVNEYFLDHPDAVLGELRAVHGAHNAEDLVVAAPGDTGAALARALARIAADATSRGLAWTPAPEQPGPSAAPAGRGPGSRTATWKPTATAPSPRSPTAMQSRSRYRTSKAPSSASCSGSATPSPACWRPKPPPWTTLPSWTPCAGTSTCRYDTYLRTYGPISRFSWRHTGRTDPGTGEEKLARIRPPQGGFRSDPFAPLVQALEEFDPVSQTAAKAAIFTSRVVAPRNPRLGADNPADALAICLDVCGEVQLAGIARLLGTDEEQGRQDLGTLVFDDPGSGRLVPAAEYLSGRVRDKLEAAEQAAADDPRYEVNVEELRKVIPADLMPGEIDARLGAAWIDASWIRDFLRDILDDDTVRVEHPGGQVWTVRGNRHTVLATSTWGTSRYPAPQLAQAVLEQRRIEVRDKIGDDTWVLNIEDTLAAQEKAAELADRFAEWAWEDPARAAQPGGHLQPAVQRHRAAQLRRRPAVPARPGDELRTTPAPGRRRRPDHQRARRRPVPRGRRRENRRDDHGRDGTAPPAPGPKARHHRAQPHARAVQPRVPPALPPGQGPGHPARRPPGRPAPPVHRPLRDRGLGRGHHVPVRLRAHPDERRRPARLPGRRTGPDAGLHPGLQGGRRADRQAPRRRPAARRGTAQGQARLGQGPGHHLRGHRYRLPVRRRGARVQEPPHPVQHPRRRDRRVHARRRPGHEDQLPASPQRHPGRHLRHRHPDRQQHHRSLGHAALPAPRPAGSGRRRRLRQLGRHLRPDRHPDRDGPRRRRQLPAEDPLRQVHQRAGNAPPLARLRRHQDRRGPPPPRPRPGPPGRRRPARPRNRDHPALRRAARHHDLRSASAPTPSATGKCCPKKTTCSRSAPTAARPPSTCACSTCP